MRQRGRMALYKADHNLGVTLRVPVECLSKYVCVKVRFIFESDSMMTMSWNVDFKVVKQGNQLGGSILFSEIRQYVMEQNSLTLGFAHNSDVWSRVSSMPPQCKQFSRCQLSVLLFTSTDTTYMEKAPDSTGCVRSPQKNSVLLQIPVKGQVFNCVSDQLTSSLGLIKLLPQVTKLRKLIYSVDYKFILKVIKG